MVKSTDGCVLLSDVFTHCWRVLREVRHDDVIGGIMNRCPVGDDAHTRLTRAKLLAEGAILGIGSAAVRVVESNVEEERSERRSKRIFCKLVQGRTV